MGAVQDILLHEQRVHAHVVDVHADLSLGLLLCQEKRLLLETLLLLCLDDQYGMLELHHDLRQGRTESRVRMPGMLQQRRKLLTEKAYVGTECREIAIFTIFLGFGVSRILNLQFETQIYDSNRKFGFRIVNLGFAIT
jgi:hypothetical protein